MQYVPGREACPLPYAPFKACTVPRPIGWLSTISAKGVPNLARFSQWRNLTFDPPMVMFAANQMSDGTRKHTVVNAEETGWFVWNMATYDLRGAVNIAAMEVPERVDEFDRAGVTKQACIQAHDAQAAGLEGRGSRRSAPAAAACVGRSASCAAFDPSRGHGFGFVGFRRVATAAAS